MSMSDAEWAAYNEGRKAGLAQHRPDRGRNCGTCDFWQRDDKDVSAPTPWLGTCRKNAPGPRLGFPPVTNEDWCNEYVVAEGAW